MIYRAKLRQCTTSKMVYSSVFTQEPINPRVKYFIKPQCLKQKRINLPYIINQLALNENILLFAATHAVSVFVL